MHMFIYTCSTQLNLTSKWDSLEDNYYNRANKSKGQLWTFLKQNIKIENPNQGK